MSSPGDHGASLRPEFLQVVDIIYREMCNLQPGTKVLIVADSRTPRHVVSAFMGTALAMGGEAMVAENKTPPPPAVQPSIVWNDMVIAASREADLIVDLAVGYADFMVDAVQRGARIIMPGDGTGGWHIEESLIRTILAADIHALRKEADHIVKLMNQARAMNITSEEGTDITFNVEGLEGVPQDGFLWDPDQEKWKGTWEAAVPAAPTMVLPKGRGNGILAVDGFLLYEPAYDHEIPTSPVYLTIKKGKIVKIEGHPLYAGRLRHWLASQKDNSGYFGPIHITLGLNPRAMLTQHLEFECIRGTITFGFGDSSGVARLTGYDFEPVYSDIHWDVSIMRPTMKLDDKLVVENGVIPDEPPSL